MERITQFFNVSGLQSSDLNMVAAPSLKILVSMYSLHGVTYYKTFVLRMHRCIGHFIYICIFLTEAIPLCINKFAFYSVSTQQYIRTVT